MEIKVGSTYTDKEDSWFVVVLQTDGAYVYCVNSDNMPIKYSYAAFLDNCTPIVGSGGSTVHSPQHYQVFPDKEAIEIIASSMTTEQFYGYCLGNFLKYRLRIGAKDEVQQELGKSNKYKELYEKHKHLCK
ncbi:nucleotide kinase [Aeromonas phage PS]|uniref:Nucleotide kinase n=1 Tax=Aeromonas phage PS TaxID=2723762 RepID=A0A6H0X6M9_9CAUD|nr:hypothetical protein [Aeromonas phage PS]